MNDLIRFRFDTDNQTISARELHEKLKIVTRFNDWIERMISYGFIEGRDFYSNLSKNPNTVGRPSKEYDLSIGMAKELCMIQRSPIGKKIREYLIQVEDAWNNPRMVYARAVKMADAEIHSLTANIQLLEAKIEEDKPKVLFADAVAASNTSILIGDLAKILRQNGIETGQKRLFAQLRKDGFLLSFGNNYNMPSQRFMEMGLFEIKENTINNPDGSIRITKTVKVTGKGQTYFINKYLNNKNSIQAVSV